MNDSSLVDLRRKKIKEEIAALDKRRDELEEEQEELDIAARVLARLTGKLGHEEAERERRAAVARKVSIDNRGKPDSAPTVPKMIVWCVEQAKANGIRGLEPKQIRPMIAEKWWPEVPAETVNSIAWRMWKRDQLAKDGPLYMLPQKDEAAGTPDKDAPTASAQEHPNKGVFG